MARPPKPHSSFLSDALIFASGALLAFLAVLALSSLHHQSPLLLLTPYASPKPHPDVHDPAEATFYDDPSLSYAIDSPVADWDAKRRRWLLLHPSLSSGAGERVVMVSGSQPSPCRNPVGDHLLLRLLKNKVDYCRRHGVELLYNTALLHPAMPTFWAKIPLIRAAMLARPEAEWIWWVDSDAALTDMDFALPLRRYAAHNLVVHGWPHLVYDQRSWVSLNAGVFLIRNCQWSLDFMADWAAMGPRSPDYHKWGTTLKNTFRDKLFNESDDQSALVYLLLTQKEKWGRTIFLEHHFYFEGYWLEIVARFDNITRRYEEMERRGPAVLRRRHAEAVAAAYARARDERLAAEPGAEAGPRGWRRPFITHFTGCQPCSGDHNKLYSGENCYEGMRRALAFADDQVLRNYGFRHAGPLSDDVRPLPFNYPGNAA